jgi:pyridoxal phosphate enzyme (YggS family)|tara:strand:- start:108 stop:770 length:663 start_codon:yes stop_codon:yes gene_type:complete
MHKTLDNLILIQKTLKEKLNNANIPTVIAVSKTFPISEVLPLINHGHEHFGENKVQEAIEKWSSIKSDFKQIKLHMIGSLQSNKVKYVLPLFDYIHSLDSLKLAEKISNEQKKIKKRLKIFIQINIGQEIQKSGIEIEYLEEFYKICVTKLDLEVVGLMCLPPKNNNGLQYFLEMKNLCSKIGVKDLSMGMSNDYIEASNNGSTFVRIGSNIFGERTKKF